MLLGLLNAVRPLTPPAHAEETTTDGEFVPLWASPLLETKTGIGTPGGAVQKVPANGTMTFQALGQGGLPASGVSAVSLAVHAVTPTSTGFLSVYPSDLPTTISTVSFVTGESSTNADLTKITATGQITVANSSDQSVDVLVAVDGYFKSGGAATTVYKPLTTAVLWDTRAQYATGTPARTTPMDPWSSIEVQVAGQAGIPTQCDQSAAVALNMVALEQTNDGELKVEPTDSPIGVGTLQFTANDWNNSTFSIVQMGCSGKLRVTNSSPGAVNVSLSVRGYFTYWDADDRGARYKPAEPTTILDTAAGVGTNGSTNPMNGESHLIFDATGPSGVPVNTVSAVAMQIKVINPTAGGWITFRPEDQPEIPISSLVYQQGEDASGFETQIPSGLGRIAITNHGTGSLHVQITVRGFYIHKTVEVLPNQLEAYDNLPDPTPDQVAAMDSVEEFSDTHPDAAPAIPLPDGTIVVPVTSQAAADQITDGIPVTAGNDTSGDDSGVEGEGPHDVATEPLPEQDLPPTLPADPPTTLIHPTVVLAPNDAEGLDQIQAQIESAVDADQLPGSDAVYSTYVQPDKNRVVVQTTSASAEMQDWLTDHFGPSKVAVELNPDAVIPEPTLCTEASRTCMIYPAAIGQRIQTWNADAVTYRGLCTSGFVWNLGSGNGRIITAGHCVQVNGYLTSEGGVQASTTSSNWIDGVGTSAQGDISANRANQQSYIAAVFTNGTKYRWVRNPKPMHSPSTKDKLWLSGISSGESKGWRMFADKKGKLKVNIRYSKPESWSWATRGKRTWVKDVRQARKYSGKCALPGDSGGPIYTVINGYAIPKGILSGSNGHPTKHLYGSSNNPCIMYFTDIMDVKKFVGGEPFAWS